MIKTLSNTELLLRIANDDKKAFEELFYRLHVRLIKFCVLYVKSYENAEDIVSDVFYQFLKNRAKATAIQDVEKYLYQAVKLQSFKFLRKSGNKGYIVEMEDPADYFNTVVSPESLYLDDELEKLIINAVESLPPKRKVIFKMIKEDGMKYQEVAEIMDVSIKTIETHMSLAIKDLKHVIFNYYNSSSDFKVVKLPLHLLLPLILSIF